MSRQYRACLVHVFDVYWITDVEGRGFSGAVSSVELLFLLFLQLLFGLMYFGVVWNSGVQAGWVNWHFCFQSAAHQQFAW
jgi:hypothetical protein